MTGILVLNGPNLSLLGTREPDRYGSQTLADVEKLCREVGRDAGLDVGVGLPVIELHITNVHQRESFRHHSYISPVAAGVIVGLRTAGYEWAIRALAAKEVQYQ